MATKPLITSTTPGKIFYTWNLAAGETGDSVTAPFNGGLSMSVHMAAVGGASTVMQVSNDGSNFLTMADVSGSQVTADAPAFFEVSTGAEYFRPVATAASTVIVRVTE